ncbi:hypothetical protein B566_EDAN008422 [Ephemera danica]|nr:hypothetical protein B566_EDAN008422 [Ephemera danica]
MRAQWRRMVVLLSLLTVSVQSDVDGDFMEDVESSHHDVDLCNMLLCECRDHDTNEPYVRGSNVTVDIFCSCAHSNWKVIHLLSPHPVPPNTYLLHVTACDEVKVTTVKLGPNHWAQPHRLVVTDVPKLTVDKEGAFWASEIVLNNIGLIPVFPAGILRCASFENRPIHSFRMINVTIDIVETDAFALLHVWHSFELTDVKMRKVDEHGFVITVQDRNGEFKMVNSSVESLEMYGLAVQAPSVVFQHCNFTFIEMHGIRVRAEKFVFANSSVQGYAKGFAFAVEARVVAFVHNTFNLLETQAFFAVRKREHFDPYNCSCLLAYANNHFIQAHPGSLNPNWTLGSRDLVQDNVFEDCSCASMRWLWDAKYGNVPDVARTFYTALIDLRSGSLCKGLECHLPLQHVVELFQPMEHESADPNVVCSGNATYADMCE